MKDGIKSLLAIGLISVLAGCKLAVIVPSGGDVTSSSGTRNCTAGSSCEFNVADTTFSESFTAIPKPGYKFTKWQGGQGFLCADSIKPTCTTSNTAYAGNADIEAFIATEQKLSIKPLFEVTLDSLAATAGEQAGRLMQIEEMLQSRYKVPVVVDANDNVVGTLVGASDVGTESSLHIAVKFEETGDNAYMLHVPYRLNNPRSGNGFVRGRGGLYFSGSNCTGTPYISFGQGDLSGDYYNQEKYFIHSVVSGPDNTSWVPDPQYDSAPDNPSQYSSWDVDFQTCRGGLTQGYGVPAIPVEMSFQFPLRVVFR